MPRSTFKFIRRNSVALFFLVTASDAFAKKIVIIGAGLSGLAAADALQEAIHNDKTLQNQKIDLEVYEAKKHPGGRVFTAKLNNIPVELGGENIHDGGDAPYLRGLIQKVGLKTQSYSVNFGNNHFYDPQTKRSYQIYRDLMPAFPNLSTEEIVQTLAHAEKKSTHMGEVLQSFFDQFPQQDPEKIAKLDVLKRVLSQRIRSYEGGEVQNLSPRYAHGSLRSMILGLQKDFRSGQSIETSSHQMESIKGGNSLLPLKLAKKLGSHLHLGHPLQKVLTSEKQLELVFANETSHRKPSMSVKVDIVVLTLPLPAYKNIHFGKGTLSVEQLDQFASISYGTHAKILIPYRSTQSTITASTDGMSAWITPTKKTMTLYLGGEYGVMRKKEDYLRGYELGIQTFQSAGTFVKKDTVEIPTHLFANSTSPIGLSWAADPYIGGSYSYYSSHSKTDLESIREIDGEKVVPIFAPIDSKIFFAGEHTTTSQDIRGTMEAAVESGKKAARMILKELKKSHLAE